MNKWIAYENTEGRYNIFDSEDNYIQFGMCAEDAVRIVDAHNKGFDNTTNKPEGVHYFKSTREETKKFNLNEIYNMADYLFEFANLIKINTIKKIHYCKECGTELCIAYLENTNYMIWCPWCGVISLAKESNPERAFRKIGIKEGEESFDERTEE